MKLKGSFGSAKVFTNDIEDGAREQIKTLLEQDFIEGSKIRIMPDVHQGMGCVIGFTADMGDKVIPNIVGVDIGCGVLTIDLGHLNLDLEKLDKIIYNKIPSGQKTHKKTKVAFPKLKELYVYDQLRNIRRIENSIGSLGGGNHFIEIGQDSQDRLYMMIHSGSRNLGNQVAKIYQRMAIDLVSGKKGQDGPSYPRDLCYLTGKQREEYLHDMAICQEYAQLNREMMAEIILQAKLGKSLKDFQYFHTVHNYIDFKDNIIRKGAISAYEDERLLIPINMRDGSILGRGKSNPDWNYSAPHGAGRLLSRRQAQDQLKLADFKEAMEGIYSSSVHKGTLDESPEAYKTMDYILDRMEETVEVEDIIRPIYNFKA